MFKQAFELGYKFTLVVVDSGPEFNGRQMVQRLNRSGIKTIYTLISGVQYMLRKTSKVFLGSRSVLSNGAVSGKAGTSIIACMAH